MLCICCPYCHPFMVGVPGTLHCKVPGTLPIKKSRDGTASLSAKSGSNGARTHDLLVVTQTLSQLSYASMYYKYTTHFMLFQSSIDVGYRVPFQERYPVPCHFLHRCSCFLQITHHDILFFVFIHGPESDFLIHFKGVIGFLDCQGCSPVTMTF